MSFTKRSMDALWRILCLRETLEPFLGVKTKASVPDQRAGWWQLVRQVLSSLLTSGLDVTCLLRMGVSAGFGSRHN